MLGSTTAEQANRLSELASKQALRKLGMFDSAAAKQAGLGIIDSSDPLKPSATGQVNSKASKKKE
jgi:hypothetical protein